MKQLLVLSIAFILTGCGGGGDSTPVTPPAATANSDDNEAQGTAALNVAPEFDFKTDVNVALNVAANLVNERAFINICQADALLINADTCFVRAPLDSEGLDLSFVIPHQDQKLKAQIWFYDTSMAPLNYEWQFDESQSQQSWLIN